MAENEMLPMNIIQSKIHTIRGLQVMLDRDLAEMFGVEVKRLNEQVKRNLDRFPPDFYFQLTKDEFDDLILRSQFATSSFEDVDDDSETPNLKSQIVISSFENAENIQIEPEMPILKSQIATSSYENAEIEPEMPILKSQIVTSSSHGGIRKMPYAFTEQGVSMLSAVLRSEVAVKISVQVVRAFVAMRKTLAQYGGIIQRIEGVEQKQVETDKKIDKIFDALQSKDAIPKCGIFFDGQIFDAYVLANKIIKSAKHSIILIDNYIDESVLTILAKKSKNTKVTLLTKDISKQMKLDVAKFDQQYPSIESKIFSLSHDRFLIIDEKDIYHLGASLKDLGKKWFAFSKMDAGGVGGALLDKIKNCINM